MIALSIIIRASFLLFAVFAVVVSAPNQRSLPENKTDPKAGDHFGSAMLLLKGDVYPTAHYVVSLNLGNPPKSFDLDLDTGSVVSWVQCDAPCRLCSLPKERQYKPPNNPLLCNDPICSAIGKHPCAPNDQCGYNVKYLDQGYSQGTMVKDKIGISLNNRTLANPVVAFGCGQDQTSPGQSFIIAGVLGLGDSKASILSQLNAIGLFRNIFGHCLGRQDGALILGDDRIRSPIATWVPLSDKGELYASGPAELSYSGRPTGIKGLTVFFDSGSTYTLFNPQAYQIVLDQIKNDVSHLIGQPLVNAPEDKTLPVCWKRTKETFKSIDEAKGFFKPLALVFTQASNAQFQLPPEAYLIVNKNGNVCLGILPSSQQLGNIILIGDVSMQDKMVIYDNEKLQIGWFSAKCKAPPNL